MLGKAFCLFLQKNVRYESYTGGTYDYGNRKKISSVEEKNISTHKC